MSKLTLSLGALLALVGPLQGQDAEAKAVFEKALKAHGDEKIAIKMTGATAKAKGTIHIMDMKADFTFTNWTQQPDKVKSVIQLNISGADLDITQVVNGKKGWVNLAGSLVDMEEDQIKEAQAQMYVEKVTNLFAIKADKDIKLSPLGETKVGDVPVVGLQVTKKDKRDVSLYFDKKTYLLIKAEYRAMDGFTNQEVTQEKLYSEYKELVPGIKTATKLVVNNDNKPFMEAEILEARLVERHDDSIFAKPD